MTDIPKLLGLRYEVGDLIGRGGMAQVHIGYDTRLSRTVAIKVLRSDLASDPTFVARFRREAQSAAALNHPSIVAVYDTGEEKVINQLGKSVPLPYIVMEYVRGRTVAKLLSSGEALPIKEAVEIIVGVLSALEYSHHEGIVHRDIKPGNIMLTKDGKVKVMDFGIARAVADSAATMTSTNSVVGTAQYLSPEQARGEVVDARSDLYSAGCLLYELLTGRPPFQGDSAVSVAYQHVSEAPKPASTIASDIPNALDRVVMKSLAKRREDRYQDAAQMRSDLLSVIRGEDIDAPSISAWQTRVMPHRTPPRPSDMVTQVAPGAALSAPTTTSIFPGSPISDPNTLSGNTQNSLSPVQVEQKSRAGLWAFLIFLVIAAIGTTLWFTFAQNSAVEKAVVAVPNLKDSNQVRARQLLEDAGLVFVQGEPVEDPKIPAGLFVSSDPKVGAEVKRGTEVTVHFSSGAGEVAIPDLTSGNVTEEAAIRQLKALGLEIGTVKRDDHAGTAEGIVFATEPSAGSKVSRGSAVQLIVASGEVSLPNLVGKTLENAQNELNQLKLNFDSNREHNEAPQGTVLRQEPLAGKVPYNTRITLVISDGPQPAPQVPSSPNPESEDNPNNNSGENSSGSGNNGGYDGTGNGTGAGGNNSTP
ncbi:Stk1 family PASTA domain-containing Ser/Thr kinase [Arcanobacterium hippocoleae]|uniref:Stk1 family PASTA domain-containing Ser/Thr kinase n=1 Tax=Arcanobacterium hippocoleae TaxID=149017 RepID=UPI003340946B